MAVRFGLGASLAWMVCSLLLFAVHAVSGIDGTDLYYFVCHGRDFATGYQPSQAASYIYFPGIYRLWAVVFSVFPVSTVVVQWTVMGVLLANACLVGALVIRLADSPWFGCLAAALYVALATRFEGLEGTGEPMATIPFLIGVLCWLSLKRYWTSLVAFGVALGLTVYMKQQAGLLTVGVAALFFLSDENSEFAKPLGSRLRTPFFLAGLTTVVFLSLLLSEGRGLLPLATGLKMIGVYDSRGSWLNNLYSLIRNDESIVLFVGIGGIGMVMSFFGKGGLGRRQAQACGILGIAAVATLLQFRVRGYYHYFLLALPGLVVIATATVAAFWKQACQHRGLRYRSLIAVILTIPFLIGFGRVGQRANAFELFHPFGSPPLNQEQIPWHCRKGRAEELQRVADLLPKGSELVVLPPSRNVIYFVTGTVNPQGYAFGRLMDVRQYQLSELEAVVAISEPRSELQQVGWENSHCEELYQRLVHDHRFEQIDVGPQMKLFLKRQRAR